MDIILARHGNTFGPNDPVVWAGSSNDLPLVEKGKLQAKKLGEALVEQKVSITDIFCGPLQRTRQYADIIANRLNFQLKPIIDSRLNEIDYGGWTGLTNEQIIERFGENALTDWDEKCLWPTRGAWGGSDSQAFNDVLSFVDDVTQKYSQKTTLLVITSNGRLRYFLKLVQSEFEKRLNNRSFKVKTGNICKLSKDHSKLTFSYWNVNPSETKL